MVASRTSLLRSTQRAIRMALVAILLASAFTPISVALATEPVVHSPNPRSQGFFGYALAGIGDINNDGVGDLLVGAPGEHSGITNVNTGHAYVLSGLNADVLYTLLPPIPAQFSVKRGGTSVASVPDVNGDDIADWVVGAPSATIGAVATAGEVYIFSGADGQWIRTIAPPAAQLNAQFGTGVVGVADVDGDGFGDILVGCPFEDHPQPIGDAGAVHLMSGATGAHIRTYLAPTPTTNAYFGSSLAVIRRAGVEQLLVGAPRAGATTSGEIYVYSLANDDLLLTIPSPNSTSLIEFGRSVAVIDDLSGVSTDTQDVLVGAPRETVNGLTIAGRVYVFKGADGAPAGSVISPTPSALARFGAALTSVADQNGDGIDDIVVGAPEEFVMTPLPRGKAHLFSGADLSVIASRTNRTSGTTTYFGAALCRIDGDRPELSSYAVGAPEETIVPTFNRAGRVYIMLDQDCNQNGIPDVIEVEENPSLDCDGNGRPDECDMMGYFADCNGNQQWDGCDIALGVSLDVDGDGIPDECFTGCFGSIDCNGNGVPDEDELEGNDCNENGIPDDCEIDNIFMTRVSENAEGFPAAGGGGGGLGDPTVFDVVMSADRRFVAFYSKATNLIPNDTNGRTDVFVKDLETGEVENIHRQSNGQLATQNAFATIDMTPDGRFVAFVSDAQLTIPTNAAMQVYIHDRANGTSEMISQTPSGFPGNNISLSPSISDDGRYVAFASLATDLVANDSTQADVFRRDRLTGTTIRVSVGHDGAEPIGHSGFFGTNISSGCVVISGDGRYVAFGSSAPNLVRYDSNNARDIFVRDCETGQTHLISVNDAGEQGNRNSGASSLFWSTQMTLAMSRDGRFIVFDSIASNLVADDTNNRQDLFIRDRQTNKTTRLNIPGTNEGALLTRPSISSDGCYVSFISDLQHLESDEDPPLGIFMIYRYTVATGEIELINRHEDGTPPDLTTNVPGVPRISPDGQWVAFETFARTISSDEPATTLPQAYLRWVPKEYDCAGLGVPDVCRLENNDCNQNLLPDDCECGCPADVDGDNLIDARDILAFTHCLLEGCAPAGCVCADLTQDGVVDFDDISPFVETLLTVANPECPD